MFSHSQTPQNQEPITRPRQVEQTDTGMRIINQPAVENIILDLVEVAIPEMIECRYDGMQTMFTVDVRLPILITLHLLTPQGIHK